MDYLAFLNFQTVEGWFEAGGYLVLFSLLFACGLGLPLPEDIPLMVAGWFVARGKMHLAIVAVCAWSGIIGGDIVLYHLGKKFGLEITRLPFVGKHVTRARIERAEKLFERYGIWVVAVGRLFAGIRGAMVIAAGATRFNVAKFVIADGLAALVSGGMFIALGYWFGSRLDWLRHQIKHWEHVLLIVALSAGAVLALYVWWRRRKHKTLAEAALEKAVRHVEHVEQARPRRAPAPDKNA